MSTNFVDKPTLEEYPDWYSERFQDDLHGGSTRQWYEEVTDDGITRLKQSRFWQQLQESLNAWDKDFEQSHEGYSLFGVTQQPQCIQKKPFKSVINKSYRRNVHENCNFDSPPARSPSTAPNPEDRDPEDPKCWFGPHNWLADFSDIFRTRLTATYFDGVRYLANKIGDLAANTTGDSPDVELHATHVGYHAAHIGICHKLELYSYDNNDLVEVPVQLEIQVITGIQATISTMLHRVYEEWRVSEPPRDWEWEHDKPAFSINYLGNALHYIEGMIVMARDQKG